MATGRLGARADRAGARDARRVRALLPARAGCRATRWTRSRPARSATPRTPRSSSSGRAERFGLADPGAEPRAGGATHGYLAAVNSTTLADGCVLDLGGGSMQLVRVGDRAERELGSWPLGTVRMSERFLPPTVPPSGASSASCASTSARELERDSVAGRAARACGGGRVAADRRDRRHGAEPRGGRPARGRPADQRRAGHGDRRRRARGADRDASRRCPLPSARTCPGIKPARADLILAGAVVVREALRAGGFEAIETTEAGLREGDLLRAPAGRRR